MGVLPAWRVQAGGCGRPRHVRQVWLASSFRVAVKDWSPPEELPHELLLSSCGERDDSLLAEAGLLVVPPQPTITALQQKKMSAPKKFLKGFELIVHLFERRTGHDGSVCCVNRIKSRRCARKS